MQGPELFFEGMSIKYTTAKSKGGFLQVAAVILLPNYSVQDTVEYGQGAALPSHPSLRRSHKN